MSFHVERIENKLPEYSGIPDLHISGGRSSDIFLELKWFGTGKQTECVYPEDACRALEPSQKKWFRMRRDLGASRNVFIMAGTPTAHYIFTPEVEAGMLLSLEPVGIVSPFGSVNGILERLDYLAAMPGGKWGP